MMRASNDEGRPRQGDQSSSSNTALAKSTTEAGHTQDDAQALFDVVRMPAPPDSPTRVRFEVSADTSEDNEGFRGPGPQPPPRVGRAPDYWRREARAKLLELAARPGGMTSDDLRLAYPEPMSASGAAIGSLFNALAREGLIRCIGFERSTRPSNNGRITRRWELAR